jgi:Domain of unknown function (DUF222)
VGGFVTGQAARERFRALADQVEFAYAEMRCRSSDEVGNEFRAEMAERLETQERSNRGLMYRVFGEIADPPDQTAMVPAVVNSLAGRLRIAPREAKRRMKVAARIRPRTERPAAAAAAAPYHRRDAGQEDRGGSSAGDQLGDEVERSLVREAAKNDAEIVKAVARRIDEIFNPDGDFDEEDRARRRGLTLGQQVLMGCRGWPAGSTRKPAPMWRRSPRPCAQAATDPTAHWSRPAMTAVAPSVAMTASN